jgi:hypothetical protein
MSQKRYSRKRRYAKRNSAVECRTKPFANGNGQRVTMLSIIDVPGNLIAGRHDIRQWTSAQLVS